MENPIKIDLTDEELEVLVKKVKDWAIIQGMNYCKFIESFYCPEFWVMKCVFDYVFRD